MKANSRVTFQTDFFQPIAGEDEETNPERYGKALALWLAEKLRARGIAVEAVIPDDWGWVVMVAYKPFMLWLGCGNTEGSTSEWTVFVTAQAGLLQRLFKSVDTAPEAEKLWAVIEELVPLIPGISHIEFGGAPSH